MKNRSLFLRRRRGLTLVELMVVVVIVGVLAALAVASYRKYSYSARKSEAVSMLGSVRAAQETYFQSFGQYCGTPGGEVWPAEMPFEKKISWGDPPNAWADLGLKAPGYVWFQYTLMANAVPAGAPNESFQANPTGAWYVARAHGDFDNDGRLSTFEVTSAKAEVYENVDNN